jgi:hypothetical protein
MTNVVDIAKRVRESCAKTAEALLAAGQPENIPSAIRNSVGLHRIVSSAPAPQTGSHHGNAKSPAAGAGFDPEASRARWAAQMGKAAPP